MRHRQVLVSASAALVAQAARRVVCSSEKEEAVSDEAKALEGVKPFVALFLDDESKGKLAKKWPETTDTRSASYVLLEPTKITSDKTRPAVFAPLMGESGTATIVGERKGDITTLRVKVTCAGGPIDGLKHLPTIAWGGESDDDIAHEGGAEESDEDKFAALDEPYLELSGTICRAEYFYDGKCHLDPLMECPLCAYMKMSPCKDVFIKWEDCLNACEAQGGSDEERQERFVSTCVSQTVALKECVDQYPDFFKSMFGEDGGSEAKQNSESHEDPSSAPMTDHQIDDDSSTLVAAANEITDIDANSKGQTVNEEKNR